MVALFPRTTSLPAPSPHFLTPASHCSPERTLKMYDYDIISQVSSHTECVLSLSKV